MVNKLETPEIADVQRNLSWSESFSIHRKLSWSQSLDAMAPRLRYLTIIMLILLAELSIILWLRVGQILLIRYLHA